MDHKRNVYRELKLLTFNKHCVALNIESSSFEQKDFPKLFGFRKGYCVVKKTEGIMIRGCEKLRKRERERKKVCERERK